MIIPLLKMSKCLRCASSQIANPQIFMINPQIQKFTHYTAQLCVNTALKVLYFKTILLRKFEPEHYILPVGFGRACAPVRCAHPSFWAHCHA